MPCLKTNYKAVSGRIAAAESQYGRPRGAVKLVAVGKLHPADKLRALYDLGQRDFAENFVQEALHKRTALADCEIEWHYIGSIQSNKTKDIAQNFSWVHSVSRTKIARRLSHQRPSDLPPLNICLQLNLQAERTKSGLNEKEILPALEQVTQLPGIRVRGFMAIPRPVANVQEQRPVFAKLRQLLDYANTNGHRLDTLSMGMTDDLEAAIAEGATHVRIGTALFGQRPPKP